MSQDTLTVRSQLIPMDGMRLVLPNTAIAEVIAHQDVEVVENVPHWVMGLILWRGLKIPLLSFEAAVAEQIASGSRRSRIVVLNARSHEAQLPFYGFLAQGIPRLMALNGSAIIDSPDQGETPYVVRHCLVDGNPAMIPDMDRFESELHDLHIQVREVV